MNINRTKLSPSWNKLVAKEKLLNNHLDNYFPNKFNTYHEPFCCGSAILFLFATAKSKL